MAGNFANAFVTVTWTSGDILTETKLDNMTANDQSHDALGAEGMTLNNTVQIRGKESGGTARDMVKINSSNVAEFGDTSLVENAVNTRAKAKAYLNVQQDNLTSGADTKVLLDTETYDVGADFDTGNSKFVTPVAGYYLIIGAIRYTNIIATKSYRAKIFINGAAVTFADNDSSLSGTVAVTTVTIQKVAASIDIELYAQQVSSTNTVDVEAGNTKTFLEVHLLSIGD